LAGCDSGSQRHASHCLLALDRSPDIIEDQITYPIVAPCSARRKSERPRLLRFGFRLLRNLRRRDRYLLARTALWNTFRAYCSRCPRAQNRAWPDATSLAGFFNTYWKTSPGSTASPEMRSLKIGTCLSPESVPGVAELPQSADSASIPGQCRSERLQAYNIPINKVIDAVGEQQRNRGRILNSAALNIWCAAALHHRRGIESVVVAASENGTPTALKTLARCRLDPISCGVST